MEMDGGVSKRRYRRIFGVGDDDLKGRGRRKISEDDSYRKVYGYVEQLKVSAQNVRRKESFEKRLFEELEEFKGRAGNGKEMPRFLENLISQGANEEGISFGEFFAELREKEENESLYGYFDCLTDGGKWGNYGKRLEELKREDEMRVRRGFRSGAGRSILGDDINI